MDKKIENNCGIKPEDQEIINIGSDPNFVFKNDPSYNAITLYDLEGNVVNVNSWIECAHYVNGGWSNINTPNVDGSRLIFSGLILCTLLYVIIKKIYLSYEK
tara:strand:- start:128 stop:433 length:306 start_codon:yes stop_codon:yes gene_type:complete